MSHLSEFAHKEHPLNEKYLYAKLFGLLGLNSWELLAWHWQSLVYRVNKIGGKRQPCWPPVSVIMTFDFVPRNLTSAYMSKIH